MSTHTECSCEPTGGQAAAASASAAATAVRSPLPEVPPVEGPSLRPLRPCEVLSSCAQQALPRLRAQGKCTCQGFGHEREPVLAPRRARACTGSWMELSGKRPNV